MKLTSRVQELFRARSKTDPTTPSQKSRFLRRLTVPHWHWALLVTVLSVYVAGWSFLSISRMYSFQTQVYDLGIEMSIIWIPYHTQGAWNLLSYIGYVLGNGTALLFFPFAIYPDYTALLVLQSFFIGAPALVLYAIGKERVGDRNVALGLAASYFVSFDVSGMNWYDFHLESIFPLLFVLGYYLFLKDAYWASAVLFVLSGLVRVPYMVFPLMLAVVLLFQHFTGHEDWIPLSSPSRRKFVWGLLFVCLAYFAALEVLNTFATAGVTANAALVHQGSFLSDFDLKLMTFALLALPFVLLLPLVRWWLLFLLPYAYLVFFVGWFHYYYPYVLTDQYFAIVVPFVYLGAVDALREARKIARGPTNSIIPSNTSRYRGSRFRLPYHRLGHRGPLILSMTILVITILMGTYLLPYGPWNAESPANYDMSDATMYNHTFYNEYLRVISYVPADNGYVVFQENLPQLLPRPLPYSQPMAPPNSILGSNFTQGHYPVWNALAKKWELAIIDYVVGEPQSTPFFFWGAPSVMTISEQLYSLGQLGIVSEASGMYVLERGYQGSLDYYVPWDQSLSTSSTEFSVFPDGAHGPSGSLIGPETGQSTNLMWALYYPFLVPGTYHVTFTMKTTSLDPSNNLLISNPLGKGLTVTSAQFAHPNTWTPVSLQLNVTGFYGLNTWGFYCNQWNGTISLSGMSIQEISPPGPTVAP